MMILVLCKSRTNMTLMKVLFITVVLGIFHYPYVHGQSCKSPNGQVGRCVVLGECASLQSILQQSFISQDDYNFVIESQCRGSSLVCCAGATNQKYDTRPPVNHVSSNNRNLPIPGSGECGLHSSDKIFGGTQVAIDEYPWMVLLEYSDYGKSIFGCGGALINNRYILTAAHCIRSTPKLKSVRLGEWNVKTKDDCNNYGDCADPVQDVPIEQTIIHNEYRTSDKNSHHDIALIRLTRPVKYTYFIRPICLPIDTNLRGFSDDVGKRFTVAGWGRTERGVWSDVKLKVDVNGVDKEGCSQVYSSQQRQIIPEQICAGGEKNRDSCGGDSGGPLMREFSDKQGNHYIFLAGIVSYGPTQCGTKGWPGIYTRVSSYLPWIESNIRP